ncbi:hypothetical protein WN943_015169 [Citrus x changshan-huyou]
MRRVESSHDKIKEISYIVTRVVDDILDGKNRHDKAEQRLESVEGKLGVLGKENQVVTLCSIRASEKKQRMDYKDLEAKLMGAFGNLQAKVKEELISTGESIQIQGEQAIPREKRGKLPEENGKNWDGKKDFKPKVAVSMRRH